MEIREALEGMIYQFGYRTVYKGKPALITGGLSALECAFEALGWEDPHAIKEKGNTCEIEGCMNEICCGQKWDDLYLSMCSDHSAKKRMGVNRPSVKQYALEREKKRDKVTGFLTTKQK